MLFEFHFPLTLKHLYNHGGIAAEYGGTPIPSYDRATGGYPVVVNCPRNHHPIAVGDRVFPKTNVGFVDISGQQAFVVRVILQVCPSTGRRGLISGGANYIPVSV
ncbi:hypothetical protein D4764_09G0003050 [Takifugu flavidus]|uniref:Uncharacterized protein n=1 Tax=Takifugu flavidus TaxID=433684 RepID=A0A5C6MJE5_9TELE|nr:hypothetical protein D4764_09G0003050 [Takifugu flavidus]